MVNPRRHPHFLPVLRPCVRRAIVAGVAVALALPRGGYAEPLVDVSTADPWDRLYPPCLMLLMDGPLHHRAGVVFPGVARPLPRAGVAVGVNGRGGAFPAIAAGGIVPIGGTWLGGRLHGVRTDGGANSTTRLDTLWSDDIERVASTAERYEAAAAADVWHCNPASFLRGVSATGGQEEFEEKGQTSRHRLGSSAQPHVKSTESNRESGHVIVRGGIRIAPGLLLRAALDARFALAFESEESQPPERSSSETRRDSEAGFSLGLVSTRREPVATVANVGFSHAKSTQTEGLGYGDESGTGATTWYVEALRGRRWGDSVVRFHAGHHLYIARGRLQETHGSTPLDREGDTRILRKLWNGRYRPTVLLSIHLGNVVFRSAVEPWYVAEYARFDPGSRDTGRESTWHHAAGLSASPLAVTVALPDGPEISLTPHLGSGGLSLARFEFRYFF